MAQVSFCECPHYLDAIQITRTYPEKGIFDYAKQNPQFSYYPVSFSKFSEYYKSEATDRVIRKLQAFVETPFDLIRTFIHLLQTAIALTHIRQEGGVLQFKAKLYALIRDLEGIVGRVAALFYDPYGLYLMERSTFHKRCYDAFSLPNARLLIGRKLTIVGREGVSVHLPTLKITLEKYKNATSEQLADYTFDYDLENAPGWNLLQKHLNSFDPNTLKALTLADVYFPLDKSALKWAVLSDEEFLATDVNALENLEGQALSFVRRRLAWLAQRAAEIPENNSAALSSEDVKKALESGEFPKKWIGLLRDEQLNNIPLEAFGSDAISLFTCFGLFSESEPLSMQELRDRVSLFSPEDLSTCCPGALEYCSTEAKKGIKITHFSKEALERLFPYKSDNSEDRKIFARYPIAEVQDALKNGLLQSCYLLSLLSADHFHDLHLSEMSKEVIDEIFSYKFKKEEIAEDKARMAAIASDEVQKAINEGKLYTDYQLSLVSDEIRDSKQTTLEYIDTTPTPYIVEEA